ncbi:hypothetical protein [Actinoplanes sp. NPDC020271]|uniref:hypothetical protein n=1 Tax=Actinoplanes sp. NPDC020271 TaxID=3363896 RepID=UPI0037ADA414
MSGHSGAYKGERGSGLVLRGRSGQHGGVSHPSPLTPALERAHSLVAAGDLAGAAVLLERAIEIGQASLSHDHPDVLATQRELASLHHQAGNAAAAKLVLEAAHEAGQFSLGDDDPLMLQISYDLGVLAEELGRRDEARVAFGRVADFGPMMLGAGHWAVVRAQAYIGQDQSSGVRVEAVQPSVLPPDNHPTVLRPEPSVQLPPPPPIPRPAVTEPQPQASQPQASQQAPSPQQSPWQSLPAPRQGNPWAQAPTRPGAPGEEQPRSAIPAPRRPDPAESKATALQAEADGVRLQPEAETVPQQPVGKKETQDTSRGQSPWGPAPWTDEEPEENPFRQLKPGVFGVPKNEAAPALFHRGSDDAVVVQRPDPVVMPLRTEPSPAPASRPDSITAGGPVPAQIDFPVRREASPGARPESVTPGVSAPPAPIAPVFPAEPVRPGPVERVRAEPPQSVRPEPAAPVRPEPVEPVRPEAASTPMKAPVDEATSPFPAITPEAAAAPEPATVPEPAVEEPFTAWPDFNRWPGEAELTPDSRKQTVYLPEAGSSGVPGWADAAPNGFQEAGPVRDAGPQDVLPSGFEQGVTPSGFEQGVTPSGFQRAGRADAVPTGFQQAGHPGVYTPPDVVPSGFQQTAHPGVYQQQQPGVYHQGSDGTWQGGAADAPAPEVGAGVLTTYGKSGNRKRGMALFAVIAATLAAVVAVAALVFTLAQGTRKGDEGDTPSGSPTLSGAPPGEVKLTDGGSKIDVSWSDPTDASVSFMITMAHPGEQLKPVSTVGPGQTSRRIEGLSPTLNYCFAVVAVYATDKFATSPQVCTERTKK